MDLDVHRAVADLAPPGEEPVDQLFAGGDRDGTAVEYDRCLLPLEWYAAEPGDQWLPALALDPGFETPPFAMRGVNGGPVFAGHLRHRRAVLECQGLEHGGFHDPAQPGQSPDVAGGQVVLDDAAVLGPVGRDDGVVIVVDQPGPMRGFTAL